MKTTIHVENGRKEMDECDGYIPGENNGCLRHVDEWWAEREMNLCHACGEEQREKQRYDEAAYWAGAWENPYLEDHYG